ncbi:MAG TPA: hypothetical protein IAB56_07310 [Candidatus Scybalousia intestinigallinarum]|nr:hypothetical protein [Candidatus Scybalousia intestinigallinarum]
MKKASLICLIFGIIVVLIGVVLFSLHFSDADSKEDQKNDEGNNQVEEEETSEYSKNVFYHCEKESDSYQGKINNSDVDISYQLIQQYDFRVFEENIENGMLVNEYIFASREDYDLFNQYKSQSDKFQEIVDEENLTVYYQSPMIITNEKFDSTKYTEDYLQQLEGAGYTCIVDENGENISF